MTCIVGMEHEGKVYIGADSYVGLENGKQISSDKIFRLGDDFLIGAAGRFRASQVMQYHLKVRPPKLYEPDMEYMVCGFAESLRQCLQAHGASKNESGEETADFEGLIAYKGKLYTVYSDYSVLQYPLGVAASGDGQAYALAAVMALVGMLPPKELLLKALEIAGQLSDGVCAPFYVECI